MLAVHLAKQVEFHSLDVTWYLMIADLGDPRLHSGTTRVAYGGPLEGGREKFGTPAIGATVRQSRANGAHRNLSSYWRHGASESGKW